MNSNQELEKLKQKIEKDFFGDGVTEMLVGAFLDQVSEGVAGTIEDVRKFGELTKAFSELPNIEKRELLLVFKKTGQVDWRKLTKK